VRLPIACQLLVTGQQFFQRDANCHDFFSNARCPMSRR
jgi:hypothetical protein